MRRHLLGWMAAWWFLSGGGAAFAQDQPAAKDDQIGQEFRVPYRRTLTNHYLVRARINGKGPFNLLVDTGAPALFVSTETAEKAALKPPTQNDAIWTMIDRFEIEGGIVLRDVKSRVEDLFQLEGMNALGLPGTRIDGVLGFTILARFRMEFDPGSDRMVWTRLDFEPKDPFIPSDPAMRRAPPELQAMNLLGPIMKFFALFLGKQPEDVVHPQGLLGVELDEAEGRVRIVKVWTGTPAAKAGLKPGDVLLSLHDQSIAKLSAAHEAIAGLRPGDRVALQVLRGDDTIVLTLTAAEGL